MEFNLPFILAFLVWVPVGIWIYVAVSWMVMSDIDTGVGIIAIGAGLGLGIGTSFAPDRSLAWIPFTVAVLTVCLFPIVNESFRRYMLFKIDIEQIEEIYGRLRTNRDDVYGMIRMSEVLYGMGMHHPAIALLEGALKDRPKDMFPSETRTLDGWKRGLGQIPLRRESVCLGCGAGNAPAQFFCRRCGADFLLDMARRRWVGFSSWSLLFSVWGLLAIGVAAAPFLASSQVTPEIRLAAGVIALLTALGGFAVLALRGVRG